MCLCVCVGLQAGTAFTPYDTQLPRSQNGPDSPVVVFTVRCFVFLLCGVTMFWREGPDNLAVFPCDLVRNEEDTVAQSDDVTMCPGRRKDMKAMRACQRSVIRARYDKQTCTGFGDGSRGCHHVEGLGRSHLPNCCNLREASWPDPCLPDRPTEFSMGLGEGQDRYPVPHPASN